MNAGADLALIRERKPLVHQITNYVVMNETANATLALGALPVMAHALQEVEEMASVASALVLNIGTLSDEWVEAMVVAGQAANRAGVPVVLDPVGAGATTLPDRDLAAPARGARGSRSCAATRPRSPRSRAGRREIRGVEAVGEAAGPELAREAARALGTVVAITGPVDHVSDGETVHAVANGHELLGTVTGTGCMSTAITGCFLGVRADDPLAAATEALVAFGVAGEDAAKKAKGPGSFHVALYDALYDLDPKKLDSRELDEAPRDRRGPAGGAARGRRRRDRRPVAAQERDARTSSSRRARGSASCPPRSWSTTTSRRRFGSMPTASTSAGATKAPSARSRRGCCSASRPPRSTKRARARRSARATSAPVRSGPSPSKPDADPPIGLGGLAAICEAVSIPVVAIGGVDVSNAADCIRAGAAGVAVIRAAADARELRAAIDAAL